MLDDKGKLCIAEVIIYPIILALCIVNFIFIPKEAGGSRETAWIFLSMFCVFKTVGSSLTIDIQQTNSTSTGLIIAASILLGVALSPLMGASCSFSVTASTSFKPGSVPSGGVAGFLRSRILIISHLAVMAGAALSAAGGTKIADPSNLSSAQSGVTYLKAGSFVYFIGWVLLSVAVGIQWSSRHLMSTSIAKMHMATTATLPFLFVRVIYSLLGAFNTHATYKTAPIPNKFSTLTGEFGYYLVLGFMMEIVVVLIYCSVGLTVHKFQKSRRAATMRMDQDEDQDQEHGRPLVQGQGYASVPSHVPSAGQTAYDPYHGHQHQQQSGYQMTNGPY